VLGVGMLGADDAKARDVIAHGHGDRAFDHRMLAPAGNLGQGNVPGRKIDLVDAGQDQLQRTALGADHQVEAARIPQKTLLELSAEQQQQYDRADPERQENEIERGIERAGADVGETQRE
jgi:hypothetical protein